MEQKKIYLVYYTKNSYDQNDAFYKTYSTEEDAKDAVINLWKTIAQHYFAKDELNYQMISHYKNEKIDEIFTGDRTHRMAIEEIKKEMWELEEPLPYFDLERNDIYIEEIDFVTPKI
jgi:hypothetical protein